MPRAPAPSSLDELERVAVAAELERGDAPPTSNSLLNFSALSRDVQELIVEQLMPELAALKQVVHESRLEASSNSGAAEQRQPGFLDDDFVETRERDHVNTGTQILLLILMLMTCKITSHMVSQCVNRNLRAARYMRYLSPSTIAVFVGWLFGVAMEFSGSASTRSMRKFSSEILYYVLLPPIVMEAGYSLRQRRFFYYIVEITTLAVVGTLVSTAVIAGTLSWLVSSGLLDVLLGASGMELVLFGALMSAVDPASTLSILTAAGSGNDDLLVSLIIGESVFNEAVVVVLTQQISMVVTTAAHSTAKMEAAARLQKEQLFHALLVDDGSGAGGASGGGDSGGERDYLRQYHDADVHNRGGGSSSFDVSDLLMPAELAVSKHIFLTFVCVIIGSVLHGVLSALLCVAAVGVVCSCSSSSSSAAVDDDDDDASADADDGADADAADADATAATAADAACC
jgi:hypothetical protein